jgi:hypothetical protein
MISIRWALVHLVGVATLTAPLDAANLIVNGGFDDDIASWISSSQSLLSLSPNDELGSPVSGSLSLETTTAGQTGVAAFQCVPVVEGTTYVFGAGARISVDPPGNAALVSVDWFTMPNCLGDDIDTTMVLPFFVQLRGVWGTTQRWETAPPGAQSASLRLAANVSGTPQSPFRAEFDNVFFLPDATCAGSPTTLCLNQGRFRVVIEFQTEAGVEGYGRAVKLTDDSGYYWFFNDTNVELVTKLLDACPTAFDRFWFFAAGLTNVEVIIRVHDTVADVGRTYVNPNLTPFAPIQDTDAFDTCP